MAQAEVDACLAADLQNEQHEGRTHLTICMDCSGSMMGPKMTHAREGTLSLYANLHPGDTVELITFSSMVATAIPRVLKDDSTDDRFAAAVQRMCARGSTAFYDAILKGLESLSRADALRGNDQKAKADQAERTVSTKRVLVVVTDGEDTASHRALSDAVHALAQPYLDNFMFVVMGINLMHQGLEAANALCQYTHCKMYKVKTQSAQCTAMGTAFDRAATRMFDNSMTCFSSDAAPILRSSQRNASRCCSSVSSMEALEDRLADFDSDEEEVDVACATSATRRRQPTFRLSRVGRRDRAGSVSSDDYSDADSETTDSEDEYCEDLASDADATELPPRPGGGLTPPHMAASGSNTGGSWFSQLGRRVFQHLRLVGTQGRVLQVDELDQPAEPVGEVSNNGGLPVASSTSPPPPYQP
ncbi:uncharacterized protein MONBRDRAFT_38683 [Monosiga brevicollis MX1]|uniref:VWFA domain-containing protein n=1 Tax=Monosiga brevicollis TaxID=81824 RepID=A9V9D8_MONBE|nr:uncharacterized protein MONBRDRAFT_38683 [Monosiga brevicollis MX1]EDQ85843.1 predicted protein [Monosiga brevicollis MX1]|eukprot:XP_001749322.1 hypothetical protein [Monosiga brevicollis MX1]